MRRCVSSGRQKIEYELVLTQRRDVRFRVTTEGVTVYAPQGIFLREVDAMVRERAQWITDSSAQLQARQAQLRAQYSMKTGMPIPLEGCEYLLEVRAGGRKSVFPESNRLVVCGTDGSLEEVTAALRRFLIMRARGRLAERVAYWAAHIGCTPGRIAIREQRTRWGSCSSKNNLNFNWKLIMAPPQALDYVVIHELCHLNEFNHSAEFWAQVARYMPDYPMWVKFLKSNWLHPFR